ncbi:MAG TPA: hypothetical protein VE978_00720 [Chitinophagales bacterium]|nr:hypothetical protein [Chitinophagales bacterium]
MKQPILLIAMMLLICFSSQAKENTGIYGGNSLGQSEKVAAGDCAPASSSIDMDINNARVRLQNGGDMWWDLIGTAKYEIPKSLPGQPENPSSMFAGAVWIGGIDAQGQLKVAAATYRQNGNDFFPGPLDNDAAIEKQTCKDWDKQFEVLGTEIDSFLTIYQQFGPVLSSTQVPTHILNWPAYGNPYYPNVGNRDMAPFEDADGNGYYDPTTGDYPIIDENSAIPSYADQMIWWVYNDKGNIHTESGATAIGMEVHTLAFAFKTNDEVNDMTFYKYKLLNKATVPIDSTFMGQWADPDLGCYTDDYVGCDVETGLGIVYNGQAVDAGSCALNYGNQPPYIGIDYFQGPHDQNGNELGMSSFLYYVNDFSVIGNPENASDYYGYLSGTWKDNTPFTFGGNGYGGGTPTNYVFPDDPPLPQPAWSECSYNDAFGDKRFIQSSGPFRLEPGATNDIVIGVVWVRPPIGTYPCPSFKLIKQADLKAQALFDNGFKLKDGPPAPDLAITELDREVIISMANINNSLGSTHNIERFKFADPQIKAIGSPDSIFNFEGYKIFQLVDPKIDSKDYADASKVYDPSKARLILQCDVKNGVEKIVNYIFDASLDVNNPNLVPNVPVLEVEGSDLGIVHTLDVTTDAFATGDKRLVNNKTYYFSAVSYAYNYYEVADTILDDQGNIVNITTQVQMEPYLAGRKNIKIYSAIPHITSPEDGGLVLNSSYGDGPELTRQEGSGNGKLATDLTDQSILDILSSPIAQNFHQTYLGGKGPVSIEVYNPKVVPSADFEFGMVDTNNAGKILSTTGTYWYLKNLNTGEVVYADTTLDSPNQQLIPDWGLQVYLEQTRNPGGTVAVQTADNNGFIEATIQFSDPQHPWLSGLADEEGDNFFNWIRSGTYAPMGGTAFPDYVNIDDNQVYENLIGRTWSPYRLASDEKTIGPAWNDVSHTGLNPLDSLVSVNVVFTPDKTKWSQCIVVEEDNEVVLAQGGALKFNLRKANSKNIDGIDNPNEQGRSWFPGYAFNPETGERLNIFFGEDSWLLNQNGRDMLWNPTSSIYDPTFNNYWIGGKHYIYVSSSKYDGCASFKNDLDAGTTTAKRNVYKTVRWCSIPLLAFGQEFTSMDAGLIPNETTIRIRVTKPYQIYYTDVITNGMPRYTFNTSNIAAISNNTATAVKALDTINIVPNPYYAYSAYEQGQIDNRVKITNLPQKCTITIFSLDGTLVRKITRDDQSITSFDWDLKNDAGVPIASGLYIIHIEAPGLGERTLKWFGVLRPTDLNNY